MKPRPTTSLWRRLFKKRPHLTLAPDRSTDEEKADTENSLPPINATPPKAPHNDAVNRRRRYMVGGGFAIAIFVFGLLSSPLFGVAKVTAKPTRNLTSQQIVRASEIKRGEPLWRVWGHEGQILKTARNNNDLIYRLRITTNMWHVQLKVGEYRQAGYLIKDNRYYVVIENGRILKTALQHPTVSYPVYSGFKHDNLFANVIDQYAGLPSDVKGGISQIDFSPVKSNPERIHLFMNDGNEVYATASTFGKKMKYYAAISSQMKEKGIINLEVGAYSYAFSASDSESSSVTKSSSKTVQPQQHTQGNQQQSSVNSGSNSHR